MSRYRLADISLVATIAAKGALREGLPITAVRIIRDDLGCSLTDAHKLYKKLSVEVQQENSRAT